MTAMKHKNMIPEIWDQIRSALTGESTPSEEIQHLLDQTKDKLDSVAARLEEAKSRAENPLLSDADSEAARADYHNLDWDFRKLTKAIEQLEERHELALVNEDAAKKLSRYGDVQKKRDSVAARIKAEYPAIQKSLVSMIEDIMKVSVEIEAVNLSLPDGCSRLDRPEGIAFGIPDGGPLGVHADSHGEFNRICRMVIPDHKNPLVAAWPPAFNKLSEHRPRFNELLSQVRHGAAGGNT